MRNAFKILTGLAMLMTFGLSEAQAQCGPHNTIMNYNNGQDGNMFNITALQNVYIDSVWCNFGTGTISEIEIWTRPGTFVGNANSAAGWTMIDSVTSVTSAGFNQFTHVAIWINQFIPAGNTVAFYVTRAQLTNAAPWMRYTNGPGGSTDGQLYNQNTDIQVSYAYGKDYPFGTTNFNPRIWNGRIFYHCCPPPPTPQLTAAPNQVCPGDTFTYSVQPYSLATGWNWIAGSSGTIVGVNNDSTEVQIVFNGNVVNDTICIEMSDTCTTVDTCFPIVINPPGSDAGPDTSICATTYQLQGNNGTGVWTVMGGAGTFANANLSTTTVSGLAPGVNTLRWTLGNAECDSTFDEVNVNVLPIPVAGYSVDDGCHNTAIAFTDNSYALGGTIISWNWDVDGDGSFDYTTNAFNHSYTTLGVHQCTLVVIANGGCTDTLVQAVEVFPNPIVGFTYDPDCEGEVINFTDQTTITTGNLDVWEWQFGDGSAPSGAQNAAHVYAQDGKYVVTLTVTSLFGCEVSYADTIEVFSVPAVVFTMPHECANDSVFYTDISTSSQGTINYWEWDFGDGAPVDYNQNTAHVYPGHGTFNVRLTVATDKQCTSTVVLPHKAYPVPEPAFLQEGQCERQTVTFTDNSYIDTMFNSSLVSYHWDFGDSSATTNKTVGHFYQDPGYFTLAQTPYSNYGCHTTELTDILLRPRPEANILIMDDEVCADNEVHFRDETYFDYTYDTIGVTQWSWNFGDGKTSYEQHPGHVYRDGGFFESMLVVETTFGCIDSSTKEALIYHNPIAEFLPDTIEGCSPHCVTFFDKSRIGSGSDLTYAWSYGDGETGDEVNPSHCYSIEDGLNRSLFSVSLQVTSPFGCMDSYTHDEKVAIYSNPLADFEIDGEYLTILEPTVFVTNTSVGGEYWQWSFGDSAYSSQFNPGSHTYLEPGTYNISLLTSTDFGCLHQISKEVYIKRHQTMYIPTSFTPNGDGHNDFFQVEGEDLEFVRMWVFDRWGKQLFYGEGDEMSIPSWDGKMDGITLPIGSYSYAVEYKQFERTRQKVYGNFIISKSDDK